MESATCLASCWASLRSRCQKAYRFRSFPSLRVLVVYFQFAVLGLVDESYALYSINWLNISWCWEPRQTVGIPIVMRGFHFILAGIAAHIGRRFGRRRVIFIGWIIVFASTSCTALVTAIFELFPKAPEQCNHHSSVTVNLQIMATYVYFAVFPLYIGLACVWVNLLLLGVDVQGAVSGDQISSYYHWFYWARNLGDLLSKVLVTWIFWATHLAFSFTILSVVVCLCLILHILVPSLDAPVQANEKPLTQVFKVLHYLIKRSWRKARRPQVVQEGELQLLATGRDPQSLLDRAKEDNGGPFGDDYVDEVKKFLYVLLLIGTLIGYFAVFSLMTTTYIYQSERMYIPSRFTLHSWYNESSHTHYHFIHFIPMTVTLAVLVLVTIPLLDLLVYPCLGAYAPSIVMKVGIGLTFAVFSSGTALVVEGFRYQATNAAGHDHSIQNVFQPLYGEKIATYSASPYSVVSLLPQFLLLGAAECFVNVGAFEFVSGNAPHHMQAVLMGILFAMRGLGYFIAGSVVLTQKDRSNPEFWCYFCGEDENTANSLFAYFVMLLLLCLCVVLFLWVYASKSLKFSIRAEEQYQKMRETVFMQRCRH